MEVPGRKTFEEGILCEPCRGDGENAVAKGFCETCQEYFCSGCLRVHRKQSLSKNHVIKTKDEMPTEDVYVNPCLEACSVHETEFVRFYCKGHDIVGCGDCIVLDHKSCEVNLVQNVSGDYDRSEDLKLVMKTIEKLQNDFSDNKNAIKQNVKAARETKEKALAYVKKFREDINTHLDEVEAEIAQKIKKIESEYLSSLTKLKDETMEEKLAEFQSKLNTQSEKVNQIFVTAKLAKKQLKNFEQSLENAAIQSKLRCYHFKPSEALMNLKTMHIPFGEIEMEEDRELAGNLALDKLAKKRLGDMNSCFVKSINVQAPKEGICYISGLTMMSNSEILLADRNNRSLKIVKTDVSTVISRFVSEGAPWDVTKIHSHTAAATLADLGQIIFVSTKRGLSRTKSLKVRNGCMGIDYQNETLAVSFCYPSAVQILTLDGELLQNIEDTSMLASGSMPCYIAWNKKTMCVMVSDHATSEIFQVTLEGKVDTIAKCSTMKYPRGLVVTHDGTIIVCFQGNDDMVGVIATGTDEVRIIRFQNVMAPNTLCFCQETNTLYMGGYSTGCNELKVFELK